MRSQGKQWAWPRPLSVGVMPGVAFSIYSSQPSYDSGCQGEIKVHPKVNHQYSSRLFQDYRFTCTSSKTTWWDPDTLYALNMEMLLDFPEPLHNVVCGTPPVMRCPIPIGNLFWTSSLKAAPPLGTGSAVELPSYNLAWPGHDFKLSHARSSCLIREPTSWSPVVISFRARFPETFLTLHYS